MGETTTNESPPPLTSRPKRIVICLDGTWNNPAMLQARDDAEKVFKPTNVLKTSRAVRDVDDTTGAIVLFGVPRDGETVTLAGETYTFRTAPVAERRNIRIDDTAWQTLENLRFAINHEKSTSDRYGRGTEAHPLVRARKVAGNRQVIELVRSENSGAGDPFALEAALSHGYVVEKASWAETARSRGLDPNEGTPQITYYDIGVGAQRAFPGVSNWVHRRIDRAFGGAAGAGFEANIEAAYTFLALNYVEGDEIYVFGFSRGACAARGLCRFVDWMGGVPPSHDAFWIPRYFDAFLTNERSSASVRAEINPERVGSLQNARIRFLGVWDSVLALGRASRERPHVGETPPAVVDHARQALAIDEHRASFRPRIWRRSATDNPKQTLAQRWFPGVHTNVGGGYVHDGLANQALAWILDGARDAGLGLDWSFLRYYRRGHHTARHYESLKAHWKVLQTVTFQNGVREIEVDEAADLTLHASVLQRLVAEEVEKDGVRGPVTYRPKNLLKMLAEMDDLDGFVASITGLPEGFTLPESVRSAIEAYR